MQANYPYSYHSSLTRPWALWASVATLVVIGAGALPAGYGLISDPTGRALGFPEEMLATRFFPDYLVPGLFLFFVNGVGSLAAAAALLFHPQWATCARLNPIKQQEWPWTFGVLMGVILMAWIVIQFFSITLTSPLQPAVFLGGAWIVISLMLPAVRKYFRATH